jgi:hypothetical protein
MPLMELDALRMTAQQFVDYTDALLASAEQGRWRDFLTVFEAREALMDTLIREAGDELLKRLPDMRQTFELALGKNLRIQDLAAARRDELGEELSTVQQQRRLRMTYR